jgi:hypothetical protein
MANTRRGKKRWSLYRIHRAAPKKSRKKEQHIRKTPLGRGLSNKTEEARQPPPIPLTPNLRTRARFASLQNYLESVEPLQPIPQPLPLPLPNLRTRARFASKQKYLASIKPKTVVFGQRVSPRTAQAWQTEQEQRTAQSPQRLVKAIKETPPIIGVNPLENERMKDEVIEKIEEAAERISKAPNYEEQYSNIKQLTLGLEFLFKDKRSRNNPFNDVNIDIESLKAWNQANLRKIEDYDIPSIYITNYIMTIYVRRAPNIYRNIQDRIMAYRNHKEKISNHLNYVIDLVIEQKKAAIQENFFTTGPHFEPAGPRFRTFDVNEKRSKFPLQPPMVDKFAAIGTLINPKDIAPAIPISEVSTERMTSFLPAVFIKILETKVEEKIREAEAKLKT